MKIGIDNYCYHRFFGEIYAQQKDPGRRITIEWFIDRAKALGVDGVSLESCFFPGFDAGYLDLLKAKLDAAGLMRVFAWGHPDGLEGGKSNAALDELIAMIPHARRLGADVMRVVGSSLMFRFENHQQQIERLTGMFKKAVAVAKDHGVKLAIENHIDFTSDEIVQLLDEVDSDHFGVNFDTANFARLRASGVHSRWGALWCSMRKKGWPAGRVRRNSRPRSVVTSVQWPSTVSVPPGTRNSGSRYLPWPGSTIQRSKPVGSLPRCHFPTTPVW
jgi:hypothetical protein